MQLTDKLNRAINEGTFEAGCDFFLCMLKRKIYINSSKINEKYFVETVPVDTDTVSYVCYLEYDHHRLDNNFAELPWKILIDLALKTPNVEGVIVCSDKCGVIAFNHEVLTALVKPINHIWLPRKMIG